MLLDRIIGLDSAHRQRQVQLQVAVGTRVSGLFRGLTPADLLEQDSPAVEAWLSESTALLGAAQDKSASYARDYYDGVAKLMAPDHVVEHSAYEPSPIEQLRTSLFVTGVVHARQRLAEPAPPAPAVDDPFRQRQLDILGGATTRQALDLSADDAAGAAMKLAADGGREQVKATVRSDRRALGWIRITRGQGTCFFCAMLASRGPAYEEDSFDESDIRFEGPGRHKVHDHCSCSLRPVFTRSTAEIPQWNFDQIDAWRTLSKELERKEHRAPTLADWRADYASRTKAA